MSLREETEWPLIDRFWDGGGLALDIGHGGVIARPGMKTVDADANRNPHYLCQDASILPMFGNETVDFIYTGHLIEHVDDPVACFREWHRILKPGHILIVVVPDVRFVGYRRPPQYTGFEVHKHDYTPEIFRADVLSKVEGFEELSYATLNNSWSFECVLRRR